jgi:hypothetical protein
MSYVLFSFLFLILLFSFSFFFSIFHEDFFLEIKVDDCFLLVSNHHMSTVDEYNEVPLLMNLVFPHYYFLHFLLHHGDQ